MKAPNLRLISLFIARMKSKPSSGLAFLLHLAYTVLIFRILNYWM